MLPWIAAAAMFSTTAVLIHAGHLSNHIAEHIDRQIKHLERFIMSEAQDAVNTVVEQLRKVALEVRNELNDVQNQLDEAQIGSEKVDLSALTEAAQALDDIVPDAEPAEAAVAVDPAAENA